MVLALDARTRAFQSVDEPTGFKNTDRTSLPLWTSSNQTDEQNLSSSNSEGGTQTDEMSDVDSPQRVEGFDLDLLESRDSTMSSPLTAFSEGFEGVFPGDNWLVGDGNANNGLDYWDDTSYRSQAGSWSGWCADIGSQTSTILSEDFEGGFPGSWTVEDFDSGSGNDLWDDTYHRSYEGSRSAWCAEIGTKMVATTIFYEGFEGSFPASWMVYDDNEEAGYDYWGKYSGKRYLGSWSGYCANEGTHPGGSGYDNYMEAYMYRNESLSGYSSVSLSYYYWLDCQNPNDKLYVYYYDGSDHFIDEHTGYSGGWQYSSVSIPTSALFIGFLFFSDSSVCNFEGAFIDEVRLTGTSLVPNNSVHEYDNYMETYMYHSVSLSGYSSVTLSYYYWLDCESGGDWLGVSYYLDGSWHDIDGHTGNSGGWGYSSVSIPTSASDVGFHFSSDDSECNYEGAYIDQVRLTGIISNPSLHKYDDNMDASMVRKYTIDASTWMLATLYYWAWYQTESSLDYCQVTVTDDAGSHWYYIGAQLSGTSGWSFHSLSIPSGYLTSLFNIGFKFHSDGSVHYEGVYLDNIILEYEVDTDPPPAPVISSPTHTNEDDWFSNNDPGFEWTTPPDPFGIEGYSYILDHSPSTTPDETVDTTGNSASFLDRADDEWWFHVRAKDIAGNWGAADHYRIRVDTTPPSTFIIHAPGSDSVYLEAADPTPGSGVYAIYVRIDGGDWTEYPGAGPVEIPLAGTEGHFIETYSKDNANPRNSESPKTLVVLYLTVNTNPPGLDDPTGQGWYDLGTVAYVNVDSVAGYIFEYWYLDGQVGTPYSLSMGTSIFMDDPHTLTAKFQALIHDIAVIDVLPLKNVVYQGYSVSINVTVENQGDYTETFNVTAYYSNATITPEQWETFWSMGDVNRDGYIDDIDWDLIDAAYGSIPGDYNWNPDADLNQDLIVDMTDGAIFSLNYGLDIWTEFDIIGGSIGRQTVYDLSPGDSKTLVFIWNTTDVPYGDYIISAKAPRILGETDTADNYYDDGIVKVAIPGDVNLDGIVDIYDGVLVAAALGARLITEPEDIRFGEYWHDEACSRCPHDPLADINQDGVIDSLDLEIVEDNMGRTE